MRTFLFWNGDTEIASPLRGKMKVVGLAVEMRE
jgi:hypothetical protein